MLGHTSIDATNAISKKTITIFMIFLLFYYSNKLIFIIYKKAEIFIINYKFIYIFYYNFYYNFFLNIKIIKIIKIYKIKN